MPLESVKHILHHATEHKYGVAAFNTYNYETIKWAVAAAEEERVPVIIQLYPGYEFYIDPSYIAHMACAEARKAAVPVGVHLDHSPSYEIATKGIRDGYPSVMVDGSSKPFEENVEMTAAVVRTARVFGVDVEAELGHVGSGANEDDIVNSGHYTDVDQAVEFVQRTGCDSLAIAVGNAHGAYIRTPHLDFDRIRAIRSRLDIPLVLHGCSDIPEDQIRESVNLGMSKFNIATEYFRACNTALKEVLSGPDAPGDAMQSTIRAGELALEFLRGKIRLLNPNKYTV